MESHSFTPTLTLPSRGEGPTGQSGTDREPSPDLRHHSRPNEEENIAPCVESLRKSAGCEIEIIVVDDESRDRTAEIVRAIQEKDSRVRLVRVDGLEPGWVGKSHALYRGIREARGEWLLFTDADTRHRPLALADCLTLAGEKKADLVSLSPGRFAGASGSVFSSRRSSPSSSRDTRFIR